MLLYVPGPPYCTSQGLRAVRPEASVQYVPGPPDFHISRETRFPYIPGNQISIYGLQTIWAPNSLSLDHISRETRFPYIPGNQISIYVIAPVIAKYFMCKLKRLAHLLLKRTDTVEKLLAATRYSWVKAWPTGALAGIQKLAVPVGCFSECSQ